MDILNPIDPSAEGQDIYKLKEEFGSHLTLCGNINVDGVLLKGTPEEVKSDVYNHIENLAVGGGYIVASSHDLHQLIPVENIYAMRDAVHENIFNT
jgi:uroporphyrinogen decarboxylase